MTDTSPHRYDEVSIDQQVALHTAATRLAEEFTGVYGPETIEKFLLSSYDQFATASTLPHYLPLLAERFARQCLQALARVEGHHRDGRPVVLFLCTHNAGRSQMALGSSPTSPATGPSPGPAAASLASRSTRPPSPPRPNVASTSARSSPSPGPTKWSAPRTSW